MWYSGLIRFHLAMLETPWDRAGWGRTYCHHPTGRRFAVFTDEIRLRFSLHVCGEVRKATPVCGGTALWASSWITTHVARLVLPFQAGRGTETYPRMQTKQSCICAFAGVVARCSVHVKIGRPSAACTHTKSHTSYSCCPHLTKIALNSSCRRQTWHV